MKIKTYTNKANKVLAIEYMGWNWQKFVSLSGVTDWSMLGTLTLKVRNNNRLELELGDWLVIYSDGACDILSSKDFYEEYEYI